LRFGKNHRACPQKQIDSDLYDMSFPMKDATAPIDFEDLGKGRTKVTMTVRFTIKMGQLGQMMLPMMKMKFGSTLQHFRMDMQITPRPNHV
jgi:ribosome-associated toxin RatA of RatAB toxin-antitoxin module